jgi:integrase
MAMKRENFTAGRVDGFKCEPGKQQSIYWDGKAPGLGLRVTAGAKSYIFETRLHGKTIRLTIGDVRTWPVGKAQDEATRLKTLTDQGIDPRQQKADRAAAAEAIQIEISRQQVTLANVWPRYIDARKHKWSERHAKDHADIAKPAGAAMKRTKGVTMAGPLVSLLDVKLSDLTGERIASWLDKETQTRPTSTALAFRLLRGCLNWCEHEKDLAGLVPAGALAAPKVRDALPTKAVKDDCLQREQLPLWFEHVRKLGNPVHSAYLQALLITGARREELAGIQWHDVDFQWNSITIHDKVEGQRIIPLTPYVGSLLAALPRRNEWVFSSTAAASGRLQEPRIGHNKALVAAGLPTLSLHGLRRSFGTLAEWCEVPTGVVAQIMGHKPSAIAEKHYRRRPLDLLRSWHVKIEAWILQEAGIEFMPVQAGLRVVA